MCGFLGEYTFKNILSNTNEFSDLLALSKHRGPDATKIEECEENYRLGFNRLALLDLSPAGEQPKKSPSKRFHLVFNGEIYNYKELIKEYGLEGLRSTADTEVLLHLFDAIGIIDTLKALNGMFAIAVIDTISNTLYLSRDFAGIKPLFYGKNENGIVFASQFDQIFKHEWFCHNLILRPEIVREYFAFGYMQAPNTVFQSIFQVNPGECLQIDSNGNFETSIIAHFKKEVAVQANFRLETLQKKIEKAVTIQLNSDRSLAAFLSGGIDSTLVTSYAKKNKENLEGFTLEVTDKKLNESDYAKAYANHLNLKHKIVAVDKDALIDIVDEHFKSFSEPFGDYSSIPTYMVTKKAVKFHTAMLSGDGGDELFWGYPRMFDVLKKAWWFKMPFFLRKNIVRITNKLGLSNTYAPFHKSLESFWLHKHIKLPEALLNEVFSTPFSNEMLNLYQMGKGSNKKRLQHFLRWNEFYGHMQRVLVKVDRTSMKNSLEVRVPFLDKHVIDYAWTLHQSIDTLTQLKQPLKKLVQQEIPEQLLMQEKKGFSIPIESWFKNELKEDLLNVVINKRIFGIDTEKEHLLKKYVHNFINAEHNNGWGVWHIYAWQKWAIQSDLI
ncbi:asparagine synthase (glutamine-hydrolyzing) [Marixanthomonas spongiae]|uniref:asparagine synthase (glutamine-hydrolyzing) n=1 Tax=Marixanthomonas spongiae TaxID=2174845 RepID=A0A2U0I5S1_9FLAO|nr:asparagine synthase (glutamine-hydrolyzing) [Marixanthomonas spongiae]PVW16457.1 asparagine synthase (glutamine-hydrolyzing) [Marixanthomonas spongiae]